MNDKIAFFGAYIDAGVKFKNKFNPDETDTLDGIVNVGSEVLSTNGTWYVHELVLMLRPIESITDEERKCIDISEFDWERGVLPLYVKANALNGRDIDYLRSRGICTPFRGKDPIREGWVELIK